MKPITSETIVVSVDDQKAFLHSFILVCKLLRINDYALYDKSDDMLAELPPNPNAVKIIFIDWNMPNSEVVGAELINQLRVKMPGIPVFVLSTSVDGREIGAAKNAGAYGWISKAHMVKSLTEINANHDVANDEFKVWI